MCRYKPLGKLAKHTFRYKVIRQKGFEGKYDQRDRWANLMYKCDDGRWRKVRRYKTVTEAYGELLKLTGHNIEKIADQIMRNGFILEK